MKNKQNNMYIKMVNLLDIVSVHHMFGRQLSSHLLCRLELCVQTTPERWPLQLLCPARNISEFCIWLHRHMHELAKLGFDWHCHWHGSRTLYQLVQSRLQQFFLISFSFSIFIIGISMVNWGITGVWIASERVSGKNLSVTIGIANGNSIILIKSDGIPQSTSLSKTDAIKTTRLLYSVIAFSTIL